MIEIQCGCGAVFTIENEAQAGQVACPSCGVLAADLIAAARQAGIIEPAAPAEPAAEKQEQREGVKIPCTNHPGNQATHNCLNCGKPLCMECVTANGYFCSAACKATVQATEPDAQVDKGLEEVDQKVTQTLAAAGSLWSKIKWPVLIAIVVVIGFGVYQKIWGPKPRVTAKLEVSAQMAAFDARLVAPGRVVVRANDELFLVDLPAGKRVWTQKLSAFAEDPDAIGYRGGLIVGDIQDGRLLLHAGHQLIALDADTGTVKWKHSEPDAYLTKVIPHARGGVLCRVGSRFGLGQAKPRLVNLALADGAEKWAVPVEQGGQVTVVTTADRAVVLRTTMPGYGARSGTQTVTNGPAPRVVMPMEFEEELGDVDLEVDDQPTGEQIRATVQFLALEDGRELGVKTLELDSTPRLVQTGKWITLRTQQTLLAFEAGPEPVWQTKLKNPLVRLAGGGDLLVAKTRSEVIAFDGKSGQEKWTRTWSSDVDVDQVSVSPDGQVYVTIEMSARAAETGESEKFRYAMTGDLGAVDPNRIVTILLQLDPATGQTRWGVKNIGRELVFAGGDLYVFDTFGRINLLSSQGPLTGNYSIRRLAPGDGTDRWAYYHEGDMLTHQVMDGKVFIVALHEAPVGRRDPTATYLLQIIERK